MPYGSTNMATRIGAHANATTIARTRSVLAGVPFKACPPSPHMHIHAGPHTHAYPNAENVDAYDDNK